ARDAARGDRARAHRQARARRAAGEQAFSRLKLDDPAYLAQRLVGARAYAKRIEHGLFDFVPSSAEEVRAMQESERERLLRALGDKALTPLAALEGELDPAKLRQALDRIVAELERIEASLEKLPSLGLVTE